MLDSQSGDVTVIQKREPTRLEPTEYSLLTMIPVGVQPNNIVVKSFVLASRRRRPQKQPRIYADLHGFLPSLKLVTPVTFVPYGWHRWFIDLTGAWLLICAGMVRLIALPQ